MKPEQMERKTLLQLLYQALAHDPEGIGRAIPPIAWASTRGHVRGENQDRLLIARSPTGLVVSVVADGMGGMRDGSHAAVLSVAAVATSCMTSSATKLEDMLVDALHFANDEVYKTLHGEGGAALAVAALSTTEHHIAHIGDARVYHVDRANDLTQLTVDDTLAAQLQCLGRSSTEPHRDTRLVQFAGLGPDLEPHVSEAPKDGRALILTTDGIHGVPSSVFKWIVKSTDRLQLLAKRLTLASSWDGGHDNATVVAIGLDNGTGPQAPLGSHEFWIPGKDLVVFGPQRRIPPEHAHTAVGSLAKSNTHKRKSRRRTQRTQPSIDLPEKEIEREVTTATFEDAPKADDDDAAKQPQNAQQDELASRQPADSGKRPVD